jgi:hypothetical protein
MTFVRRHVDIIFLGVMSGLGIALVFYATSTYGAGLATDSAWYISAAENLLRGYGLLTFDTSPLNAFPPLYTWLLAFISWLFKVDVFLVGWYLNIILIGVNIFLSGLLLRNVFSSNLVYFYSGILIITFSPSFLRMHASILTEPLFVTLMLLSIFIAKAYLQQPILKFVLGLTFLAALAPLLRFVGIGFILSGLIVIFYAQRSNWSAAIKHSLLFGFISITPFTLWSYFYNYRLYGSFLYPNIPRNPDFFINLLQALRKIFYWFVPYRPIFRDGVLDAVIAFVVVVGALCLINRVRNWKEWFKWFLEPFPFATMTYTLLYFAAVTATANTPDHYSIFSDRYYAAIIFFILMVIFISFDRLVLLHVQYSKKIVMAGLVVLAVLWISIPVSRLSEYIEKSRANGEDGYNLYNTRSFHESETIKVAQNILQTEPDANLYSNVPASVWFFTRRIVLPLPDKYKGWSKDEFKANMAGWPDDKPGYVIWFEPDPYGVFYPPEDLYLIANMRLVSDTSDGIILYVTPRK